MNMKKIIATMVTTTMILGMTGTVSVLAAPPMEAEQPIQMSEAENEV